MTKWFRKKYLAVIGVLTSLFLFTSCKNKQNTKAYDYVGEIVSVSLSGSPNKKEYSELDEHWDLKGLYVTIETNQSEKINIPIEDKSISYDCYPESPFQLKNENVNLEVKNVVYKGKNNVEYNVDFKIYPLSIKLMDKKEKETSTTINIAFLVIIPTTILTLVVLARKEVK